MPQRFGLIGAARQIPWLFKVTDCDLNPTPFWLEPQIMLAQNYGLNDRQIRLALARIEEHADEIRIAWDRHFVS